MASLRTLTLTLPAGLLALALPAAAHTEEQQKLLAADGAAGDAFGRAVATDQDTVLVGAPGAAGGGAAYVFVFDGAEFHQEAKLVAPDGAPDDLFGGAVALRGDYAIVGAPGHDQVGAESGAAYVFERSGTAWSFVTELLPPGLAQARFGSALALDGTTLVVGAPATGTATPGTAQVFVRDATGTWTQQAVLSPPAGAAGAQFGTSVTVSVDTAVVGMLTANGRVAQTGAAFVFDRGGTTWTRTAKVVAFDGDELDLFGISVALIGGNLSVGATGDDDGGDSAGAVYNFLRTATGWQLVGKRTGHAAGDLLGGSVSRAYRSTLFGARLADDEAPDGGIVDMYAGGTLINVLVASDEETGDALGGSVAAGGCWQVVGAWGSDTLGTNAGATYVYILAHPKATVANGNGRNPVVMQSVEPPAVGRTWTIQVDASAYPNAAFSQLLVRQRLGTPFLTTFGEVLIDLGSNEVLTSTVAGSGVFTHEIAIPNDPFLVGFEAAAQALLQSAAPGFPPITLTNAEEVQVGCPEVGTHP